MGSGLMFRRRIIEREPTYKIKVGHDRYGILIIKELAVRGNDLDEVIEALRQALDDFKALRGEQKLEV
jgi:hypothetical protein